jgi:hypothetical protein
MDKQLQPTVKTIRYLDPNQIKKLASRELPVDAAVGINPAKATGVELSKRIALVIVKRLKVVKQHVEQAVKMRGH